MVDLISQDSSSSLVLHQGEGNSPNMNDLAREIRVSLDQLNDVAAGRADGILANALMQLGSGSNLDVENYMRPDIECGLDPETLGLLYSKDYACQRVATFYPEEMAAGGFMVEKGVFASNVGLDKKFNRWKRKSNLIELFKQATIMADIYPRGAAILLDVNDGRPYNEPVLRGKIKSVTPLYSKDGWEVSPMYGINAMPYAFSLNGPGLTGQIDQYKEGILALPNGEDLFKRLEKGVSTQVHPDRVLWFPGIWCPPRVERQIQGSPSRMELFWKHYARMETGFSIAINLLSRISVVHVQQEGWLKLVREQTPQAQEKIRNQLDLFRRQIHNFGIIISDKSENTVEIVQRSLSEVANILEKLENQALAASGMSKLDLFGVTDGSGTMPNDSIERLTRANTVARRQNNEWLKHLEKIVEYWLVAEGLDPQDEDMDWEVMFPTTLALTEAEKMSSMQQKVTAATAAKQTGFIHLEEGRAMLASDPVWSAFIDEDLGVPEDPAKMGLEAGGVPGEAAAVPGEAEGDQTGAEGELSGEEGAPTEDDVDEDELFPDL